MIFHACHELPFTQIHIVDTEFFGDDGDQKTPVCLVVRELLSGQSGSGMIFSGSMMS